ncbi:MAG: caspase family protein [Deltaproteobacteria bacterium]|nr:caspase family protein [Deltaproteobacteria bacterium]NND26965.1 caspase family protein [Myxococcales bacterium]MBT8467086.1 caspase family protein [Deltaproteobacteria bacterium]MBT8481827.1 caspase family protein [Deltaproteobacteria bacterium]NNK08239.1 caspase family protein [Myxococcales bacterium]
MSWRLLLGALLCVLAWESAALAEERHAVVIGNNRGEAGELPLRYAEADAEKMAGVLLDVGGVAAENLVLLQGADVEAVRRALVAVNERIRSGRPEEAVLIVYYSGHADENALHLGETALVLEELRGLVQGSAAAFRLLMVDACRSGGLTQVKGGRMVPPSTIFFRDDLVGQGMVYLSATAADEDAQESEEIRGSFFTHYLVTGLLGAADADEDGAVDLNEAYRFAYDNTLRASSRSLGGSQHPTFRQDIKGKGDIVLTRWSAPGDRAFIRFPPGETWLVIRDSAGGAIIAEVGAQDRQRTISVRPGQYFVRGRGSEALLEGTVEAQPGSTTDVAEASLERTAYARLVRKGGSQAPKVVHGLQLGYRLRSGLETNSTVCQGMFGGYSADLRAVTLIGRIGFCRGRFEIDSVDGRSREIDFELRVHKPIDVRWLTIDLGLGVALSLLRQELREPQLGGVLPLAETRDSFAFHGDLTLGLQYDFGPGFYIGVEGAAMLYLFEREQTDGSAELEAVFAARLGAIVGVRF